MPTKKKSLSNPEPDMEGLFGFSTADQAPVKKEDTFVFPGEIGMFIGEQQKFRSQIIIEGEYHSSKSELATQLADAAITMGMRTALVDWEQGGLDSKDTMASIKRNVAPRNIGKLHVSTEVEKTPEALEALADHFDMVIVDSGTL